MRMRAFTILEMIINLALMGIIVSMVYLMYSYFSKNIREYSLMSLENFETQSFNAMLKEDFFFADKIICPNGKDLTIVFYDETIVQYIQGSDYIYRNNKQHRDSININNVEFGYLDLFTKEGQERLVTNIVITTELFGSEIPLVANKTYFSNYLNSEE